MGLPVISTKPFTRRISCAPVALAMRYGEMTIEKGLQELHKELGQKGLVIIGFPCNQFGGQEPGTEDVIASFCQKNYGVDFLMSEKVDVKGSDAHPLFKYLTSQAKGILGTEAIKWNFTKFLVRKNGEVYDRYAPTTKPADLKADIAKLLAE